MCTGVIQGHRVISVDPNQDNRWDTFLQTHPLATIYHHSCWAELLRETYGYTPMHLVCQNPEERFQAILPLFLVDSWLTGKRLVSVPFAPYCGPLAKNRDSLRVLLGELQEQADSLDADYAQLRCTEKNGCCGGSVYQRDAFYRIHHLDLQPTADALLDTFHGSCVRRPILRSLKNGLVLRVGESEKDLRVFYDLQVRTRKKHGVPPQPYDYFRNMWRLLFPLGYYQLLMAYYDGQPTGAVLLLKFKDTVIYQNGASDTQFLSLKPNHFLLWKAIEIAKQEGYRTFDFGTSSPQDEGLIRFKRRWGTEEHLLPYYYYPAVSGKRTHMEMSLSYRLATSVFQRLPAPLLRKIGAVSYKHVA